MLINGRPHGDVPPGLPRPASGSGRASSRSASAPTDTPVAWRLQPRIEWIVLTAGPSRRRPSTIMPMYHRRGRVVARAAGQQFFAHARRLAPLRLGGDGRDSSRSLQRHVGVLIVTAESSEIAACPRADPRRCRRPRPMAPTPCAGCSRHPAGRAEEVRDPLRQSVDHRGRSGYRIAMNPARRRRVDRLSVHAHRRPTCWWSGSRRHAGGPCSRRSTRQLR